MLRGRVLGGPRQMLQSLGACIRRSLIPSLRSQVLPNHSSGPPSLNRGYHWCQKRIAKFVEIRSVWPWYEGNGYTP